MDNLIEKLDKEITQQTRNGRDTIYVEVEDLKKLGCSTDENKTGRIYVDVNYLRAAIKRYEFKENLKYNGNTISYRQFMKEIRELEKGSEDKCK